MRTTAGSAPGPAPRKTEFGHVQLHTLEIHELARWWMRGFNPPNAERGHSQEHTKHNGKCNYGNRQ